jgi:hypothetical protein
MSRRRRVIRCSLLDLGDDRGGRSVGHSAAFAADPPAVHAPDRGGSAPSGQALRTTGTGTGKAKKFASQAKHSDPGAMVEPADELSLLIRKTLYGGPAFRRLYMLRRRFPDLARELDEIAFELKQVGDQLERVMRNGLARGQRLGDALPVTEPPEPSPVNP